MAVKYEGRYYAGLFVRPGKRRQLMPELPDVRDDGRFGRLDCKYCRTDDAPTVSSYEPSPPSVQALCGLCGAGLTETEAL